MLRTGTRHATATAPIARPAAPAVSGDNQDHGQRLAEPMRAQRELWEEELASGRPAESTADDSSVLATHAATIRPEGAG